MNQDGNKDRTHAKFFVSKRYHSIHTDPNGSNKDTCATPDFRANDFAMYAANNLRRVEDTIDCKSPS